MAMKNVSLHLSVRPGRGKKRQAVSVLQVVTHDKKWEFRWRGPAPAGEVAHRIVECVGSTGMEADAVSGLFHRHNLDIIPAAAFEFLMKTPKAEKLASGWERTMQDTLKAYDYWPPLAGKNAWAATMAGGRIKMNTPVKP